MDYVPEHAVWELTLRCNMHCLHCGSSAGRARSNELSIDECFRVADELLELGCRDITFIGGEVLLYRGWERVARRMVDGGVRANIITNAYSMGSEAIDKILNAKLENVGVSLDGLEKTHDRIRRPGSFVKVLGAFEMLRRAQVPIGVVTTVLKPNIGELEAIYDLLLMNDVELWQLQIATGMGNMAQQADLLLEPSDVSRITKFIHEKSRTGDMHVIAGDDIGYFDEHEAYLRCQLGAISAWSGCKAGMRVIGIDSVGNVKGCLSIYSDDFIEGNVRTESLKSIWTKEGNFAYNRQFELSVLSGACAKCDKRSICRAGCRGSCFFNSGSLFENRYCAYPRRPV